MRQVTHELLEVLINRIFAYEDAVSKYVKTDGSNTYTPEWLGALQVANWIVNALDETFEIFLDDEERKRVQLDELVKQSTRIYRLMGDAPYPDFKTFISFISDVVTFYAEVADSVIGEFLERHGGSNDPLVTSVKSRYSLRKKMRSIELILTTKDAFDMMYIYVQRYKTTP